MNDGTIDPAMGEALERHTIAARDRRQVENAESAARDRARADVAIAGQRALRAAVRIPTTIIGILDSGPMSNSNATVTLRQAYDQLDRVREFLDMLPRPPDWSESQPPKQTPPA